MTPATGLATGALAQVIHGLHGTPGGRSAGLLAALDVPAGKAGKMPALRLEIGG